MNADESSLTDSLQTSSGTLSELSFRLLVESVRDYALFMLDPEGRVASWNIGAERIYGFPAPEILGRSFRAFYAAEDLAAGRPDVELSTAASTGRYEEEWWRQRKNGERFRANVIVTALHDPSGRLSGFAKITRDVTERYETEQALRSSEERLRILVGQIRDYAIFLLDPQGRISTWNLGAQRILGYAESEVLTKPLSIFHPQEDRARNKLARMLDQAVEVGVARDVGWRIRKDGSRFWADTTLTALREANGRLYGFAKVERDLTDQVEAEELSRAYEAAREAIRVRDGFLSIAAHELRTPLTALQLHLQGINRQMGRNTSDRDGGRLQAGVRMAIQSGARLSDLVETLLDVSRIATGRIRLNLGEFDLAQAVREAAGSLEGFVRDTGCEIALQVPASLRGYWDRLRLEQALLNLIANASKYAPNSTIEVGLRAGGRGVQLWVRDQGPGIEPEHLARIFGRFERAASSAHYGGLGLGLYVTQQICELHGGTVHVDSTPGEGSTFTLDLPLRAEPATAEAGREP